MDSTDQDCQTTVNGHIEPEPFLLSISFCYNFTLTEKSSFCPIC